MADLGNFDANQVDPTVPFEPLPAAKYLVAITNSEMKPTKAADGSYLQLELTVLEGEHKDRKLWDRLCLNHPNPQAVKIARGTLSAICRAVNVLTPRDSAALHNLPLLATVKVRKRQDNGELTNEVSGYEPKAALTETVAPQAPANSTVAPWRGRGGAS